MLNETLDFLLGSGVGPGSSGGELGVNQSLSSSISDKYALKLAKDTLGIHILATFTSCNQTEADSGWAIVTYAKYRDSADP